jgi:hypothetical protein
MLRECEALSAVRPNYPVLNVDSILLAYITKTIPCD